jgi:hypothetical protein
MDISWVAINSPDVKKLFLIIEWPGGADQDLCKVGVDPPVVALVGAII